MGENLIDMDELLAAMEQLKETNTEGVLEMDEVMKASQRRYEEYIKKNVE